MPYNNSTTGPFPSAPPNSTSLSLLQRARDHDPEAWQRLVRLYGPLVFLWCRRSRLSRDDAADVAQNVWTAVWKHLRRFRRQRPEDSFRGWLWKITQNKIHDIRDGRKRPDPPAVGGTAIKGFLDQVPLPESDEVELAVSDKEVVMRQALDLVKVDFECRTWGAFWRVTVDDCAAADVAAELKMTVGAVYQAKYKVLHRLRDEMEGLLD